MRYAIRSLIRSPRTTAAVVATLSICVGAVAAMYSVVEAVLIRGLPFERPDRLVWVASLSQDRPDRPFTLPEFIDYRAQAKSVRLAAYANWSAIVDRDGGAQRLQGMRMSADGLSILRATPSAGRLLAAADDAPGAPRVAMLGYGYWRRAYGGRPEIVGKTLSLNGERHTVVGVLPRFFPLPLRDVDVVVPLDPERDPRRHARGSVNFLRLVGRLAPSTTVAAAERELAAIAAHLREQYPVEYGAKIGVRVTPLQEYLVATQRPTLVVLLTCVSLMVAIALVNVANLLLARGIARQGESAIRLALGASGWHVGSPLVMEAVVLVASSGIIGLMLAWLGVTYASVRLATFAPRIAEARLSTGPIALTFALCSLAVLIFSLVPAFITRTQPPSMTLRGVGRSRTAPHAQARLRSSFVVAQLTLAAIVTAATAALTQSLIALERVELGYRPDSVFVARLSLPPQRYGTPTDISRFLSGMDHALGGVSGVLAAGATSGAPLSGILSSVPFAPAQRVPALKRDWPFATFRAVTPGYLSAIGARLIAGRVVSRGDDAAAPPIVIVNRTLAQRYFETGALDRELLIDDNNVGPRSVRIVGVVEDVREVDLDGPITPQVWIAAAQAHQDFATFISGNQFWAVRVRGDAGSFAPRFLRVLHDIDPTIATASLTDLRRYVDVTLSPRRFSVLLLSSFASIALLLTTLGIYAVTAYSVEQRRREIGVRIALGATPCDIIQLVLVRTLRVASVGVVLGVIGAYLGNGVLAQMMFGVSLGSPALLAAVAGFLILTTLVASGVPGLRAAHIDPRGALSTE